MAEAKATRLREPPALAAPANLQPMLTMMMSIVHRITGGGAVFRHAAAGLVADRRRRRAERLCQGRNGSWSTLIGRLILFGYTWALIHHMLGGIRHLIWDTGYGFGPASANGSRWRR